MARLEFTKEGMTYVGDIKTPFGLQQVRIMKEYNRKNGNSFRINVTIDDVGIEIDRYDQMTKVWMNVTDFRELASHGSKSASSSLYRIPKARNDFAERAERQLTNRTGQSYDIVESLRREPGQTRDEICDSLRLSLKSGSVSEFLKALEDLGIIYSDRRQRRRRYYLK